MTVSSRAKIRMGGMNESAYADGTLDVMQKEGLGDYAVLFCGPWQPPVLGKFLEKCRSGGRVFVMDEMIDRLTGEWTAAYRPFHREILALLEKYRDIQDGSLLLCEYGGLAFYWPLSTVKGAATLPPPSDTFEEAARRAEDVPRRVIAYADGQGLPRPFVSIEASGLAASFLYRAGMDRVDFEITYGPQTELGFSAVKGASLAFGKPGFGIDMAMVWYGGNQHDGLWEKRWRTSLLHAYLRGANPVYAEHGLMDYKALGKDYGTDHPDVVRFRGALREAVGIVREHPRPAGFPLARMAVVQGRLDGYAGLWQTHQWGQRENENFRVGDAERSWDLFETFYRRRPWQQRERNGDHDYSGNPPLGQVDVVPFDAPDAVFRRYRTLIFLGRNVMDDALYEKLVRFVREGGDLLLCAAHLDENGDPRSGFRAFRRGDWSDLCGVERRSEKIGRLPYGIKFVDPPAGIRWMLPWRSPNCDPDFTDGGFDMMDLGPVGAAVAAVASDRFTDQAWKPDMAPAVFFHEAGRGSVTLVNSLAHPGAPGVRGLYELLLRAAAEAGGRESPRVEASDRVRWSVYRDGDRLTLFLLNTEEHLRQHVLVDDRLEAVLEPGELKRLDL